MLQIKNAKQAIEHFRDVWPKVKVLDKVVYDTRFIKEQEIKGFIIFRENGIEGWMVLTNGIIQNL